VRLIIAGGREYILNTADMERLDELHSETTVSLVIEGGANGADRGGRTWAMGRGIQVATFVANWTKYGNSAGPIRNREMSKHADAAVLFPGGRGTENMHQEAVKAGLRIYDWRGI
jgi:hypothetical protein